MGGDGLVDAVLVEVGTLRLGLADHDEQPLALFLLAQALVLGQVLRLAVEALAEEVRVLLREPPPALRPQEQVERLRSLGLWAEQEVGVLQVVGAADLGAEQEVRRHGPVGLQVGEVDDGAIHHAEQDDGGGRLLVLVGRDEGQVDLLPRQVAARIGADRDVDPAARRAVDETFGDRLEQALGPARGDLLEDRDAADAARAAGRGQRRLGLAAPQRGRRQHFAPAVGTDVQRTRLGAGDVDADRIARLEDALLDPQDDAVGLHLGESLLLDDPGGRVDTEGIRRPGARCEGEDAVALVDPWLGIIAQRFDDDGQRLAVFEQHALHLGWLAHRRASLEIDAVGQPGDQLAALGEELHVELRQHQRDGPNDGLRRAIGEGDGQAGRAALDGLGERELQQDGPGVVGLRLHRDGGLAAGGVVILVVDGDGGSNVGVADGPAARELRLGADLHLVAWAVARPIEVDLLVEPRLLEAVDDELPRHRREPPVLLVDRQRVLAAGGVGLERPRARADASHRLIVRTEDGLAVREGERGPPLKDSLHRASGRGDGRVQREVLGGGLEREPVERQGAELHDFAGLVHRLVGGQVREVDRRGQPDLAGQLDGPVRTAALAGGDEHPE